MWRDFAATHNAGEIVDALISGEVDLDDLLDAALASLERSAAMLKETAERTRNTLDALKRGRDEIDRVQQANAAAIRALVGDAAMV